MFNDEVHFKERNSSTTVKQTDIYWICIKTLPPCTSLTSYYPLWFSVICCKQGNAIIKLIKLTEIVLSVLMLGIHVKLCIGIDRQVDIKLGLEELHTLAIIWLSYSFENNIDTGMNHRLFNIDMNKSNSYTKNCQDGLMDMIYSFLVLLLLLCGYGNLAWGHPSFHTIGSYPIKFPFYQNIA